MEPQCGWHHRIRLIRVQDGSLATRIGETPMHRRDSVRHHLQSLTHQFDLFAPPVGDGATPAPDWRTLPAATRQALTTLIARLILEHMHGGSRTDQEVRCDD
jgi:hypothetical protein